MHPASLVGHSRLLMLHASPADSSIHTHPLTHPVFGSIFSVSLRSARCSLSPALWTQLSFRCFAMASHLALHFSSIHSPHGCHSELSKTCDCYPPLKFFNGFLFSSRKKKIKIPFTWPTFMIRPLFTCAGLDTLRLQMVHLFQTSHRFLKSPCSLSQGFCNAAFFI